MTGDKKTKSATGSSATTRAFIDVNWRRITFFSFIALVVVCLAHGATLWNPFVYLDYYNLAPLRAVSTSETFWIDSFYSCFLSPLSQPIVQVSYAIDMLSGTIASPAVFHAMNVILHICNCILLLFLTFSLAARESKLGRISVDPYVVAGAAAMLFACHPLACEAVAYVSARSALLVTFYYLAAILAFLKGFLATEIRDALIGYGLCYAFVILCVLCGSQGITVPGTMLILALLLKPPDISTKSWVGQRPFEFFALLLVALVLPFVSLLKYVAPIGNGFGLESLPVAAYLASQCKTLVTYYLRCTFAPFGLSLDPPMTMAGGFSDPLALLGAMVPVSAVVLAYLKRNSLLIAFSLVLFVLSLLPDFIVIQPELLSDRRFYLPLAAICIPCGLLFASLLRKNGKVIVVAGVAALAGLVGLSNWRDQAWRSDLMLWQAAYEMNKTSERSKAMHVWAMSINGKAEEASKLAAEELKTNPNKAVLNLILGQWSLALKDYNSAAKHFKDGLQLAQQQHLSPEIIWQMQSGLAVSSLQTGDMETAKKYAEEAVRVQPNSARLHMILGKYYLAKNEPQRAFQELQKSYMLDRMNAEVLEPLARAALGCGEKEHQEIGYRIAQRAAYVTPGPESVLLQAYAALETGRLHECFEMTERYMQIGKPKPDVYYLMYGAFKLGKQPELAEQARKKALSLDPTLPKRMRLYLNQPIKIPILKEKLDKEKGKEPGSKTEDSKSEPSKTETKAETNPGDQSAPKKTEGGSAAPPSSQPATTLQAPAQPSTQHKVPLGIREKHI